LKRGPIFIALTGGDPIVVAGWLQLMVAFDVVFVVLAPWLHSRVAGTPFEACWTSAAGGNGINRPSGTCNPPMCR